MNSERVDGRPQAGRLRIALLAHRSLRSGPSSQLVSFLREFEHYLRDVLEADIFVVGGTYRAIRRAGLFRAYPRLHQRAAGHQGGIVPLTTMVVGGGRQGTGEVDIVIYLQDPRDPTSVYPESIALKRECVVAPKPFLATYSAASEWAVLSWFLAHDSQKGRHFLSNPLRDALLDRDRVNDAAKSVENQTIALIAHDKKKQQLLQFAVENADVLCRFHGRSATGTTGALLNCEKPSKYTDEDMVEFSELLGRLKAKELGRWVDPKPSGPDGGDVLIAEDVLEGRCHRVIFFEDPHVSRQHEADIQLLERTCRVPEKNIMCLHDFKSASDWASNLRRCLDDKGRLPVTLAQAFRLLFGVELILPRPEDLNRENEDIWLLIVTEAAHFVRCMIAQRARERADLGDRARVAVAWGFGVHEVISRMKVEEAELRRELGEEGELRTDWKQFFRPTSVQTFPMVGVMGTTDPRVEANSNAAELTGIVGGDRGELASCVFIDKSVGSTPGDLEEWSIADIALFTCDEVKAQFGRKAMAPVPPRLFAQMEDASVGQVGGMFLDSAGREVIASDFHRVGMSHENLRRVALAGGAILVVGVEDSRRQPTLACLRGGLVSALVTNRSFAWKLLHDELGDDIADLSG